VQINPSDTSQDITVDIFGMHTYTNTSSQTKQNQAQTPRTASQARNMYNGEKNGIIL